MFLVLQWYYSDWDVRKAAVGGNMERLNVYIAKMFDNAWLKVRDLQKEGKNVTRFVIVLDMEKINLLQHLTPSCKYAKTTYFFSFRNMDLPNFCNFS